MEIIVEEFLKIIDNFPDTYDELCAPLRKLNKQIQSMGFSEGALAEVAVSYLHVTKDPIYPSSDSSGQAILEYVYRILRADGRPIMDADILLDLQDLISDYKTNNPEAPFPTEARDQKILADCVLICFKDGANWRRFHQSLYGLKSKFPGLVQRIMDDYGEYLDYGLVL